MQTTKMIPWSSIHVPSGANIRQSLPAGEVKRLAASLADKGQLQAIIVTNGGPRDQPYTLVAGFRRMAAFAANGWEGRDILANVITDVANDPIARLAINWTENMQREDVSPLDQAEAMHQLVSGTYPVRDGETAAPVDKKQICERFDMSTNHLGSLVRVHETIHPDLQVQARKVKAPLRLLIAMSRCKGRNEEAVVDKQFALLKEWADAQEALEAEGRKRKKRGGKEPGDAEGPKALLKPTRKIDDRGNAAQYLTVLAAKVEHPETSKEDRQKLAGMIELMRYLTGELKKFPLLTKEDFIVLEEEEEEEGEEEEGEETE